MTDTDRELGLNEEDRLPWLEAVESDDDEEGLSASKLLGFVLAALIALCLVLGGIWWLRGQNGPQGDGTLIAAQEGPYKAVPQDPGGMKPAGQGDSTFAATEGAEANGKVDVNAKPETPVAASKAPVVPAPKPAVAPGKAVTAPVAEAPKPAVAAAAPPAAPAVAGGGGLVQLGAYGSQVSADQAWAEMGGKVPGLAGLSKSVLPAAVGGNTVYRLRANAGNPASAASVCAKAKAAGVPCMVVR